MAEDIKPTIDEPEKTQEPEKVDVDGLLTELEKAGVSNTEQLQGKLKASQESFRLSQMLGETRKQNEELKALIQNMQTQPQQQQEYDDFETRQQPYDLDQSIERSVERVFTKREKAQAEMEQRVNAQWSKIVGDEDYENVKGVWDERLKDMTFIAQVRAGAIDPVEVYHQDVRKFYKGLALRSADAIKQFKGGGELNPPHVEQQGEVRKELPPEATETEQQMSSYKERIEKGGRLSEKEELDALMKALGG